MAWEDAPGGPLALGGGGFGGGGGHEHVPPPALLPFPRHASLRRHSSASSSSRGPSNNGSGRLTHPFSLEPLAREGSRLPTLEPLGREGSRLPTLAPPPLPASYLPHDAAAFALPGSSEHTVLERAMSELLQAGQMRAGWGGAGGGREPGDSPHAQ